MIVGDLEEILIYLLVLLLKAELMPWQVVD